MPLNAASIGSAIGTGVDASNAIVGVADIIITQINRDNDINTDNQRRGSLVAKYCSDIFYEVQRNSQEKRGIVVVRANLNYEISFRDGGHIGSAEIAGWGYIVYAIYWGWIKNNGERGFENWCVQGYQRQNDNVINIDG